MRGCLAEVAELFDDLIALPELPARGASAGMAGRLTAVLSGLDVDLGPGGWRLADSSDAAHRRASALLRQDLDDVEEELFRLRQVILGDVELQEALNRRARPVADRQDLVNHLLDGRAQPQSILLARRAIVARTASMLTTLSTYMEQAVAVRERTLAVVTTATELSDDQRRRIHEQVERITGREVVMHEIVDPNVLGGARVEVGNEVIDGTVASRLDQARRKLG
ncbi:MAG: F0F1 ATP synthase subunit delta [Propionibacterium sp.]|nr:F0F1 ATP synthase subunit delta [Propionibacterium sp.]